ncbi:VOC family protein [Actinoplanes sp. NPDC051411]|jgi:catechol 2,3-dioxygenase-like lactoylglutathione lyase family enzyme|uniref:VOC family protein n=1 Tax=Actinoplanes sp. NPDC051411 TaxID=3155522 RepID=UPI003423C808
MAEPRLDHAGLCVRSLESAADWYCAAFVGLGARPVMTPRPSPEPGVRMAFVADPEGNLVEILSRGAHP